MSKIKPWYAYAGVFYEMNTFFFPQYIIIRIIVLVFNANCPHETYKSCK